MGKDFLKDASMLDGIYEGMFVLEPTIAGKDWNKVVEHVHGIATKFGGEVLQSTKWGDRKLAYEIRGHKRGAYLLVYFKTLRENEAKINREAELSDIIVRHLILAVDKVPPPEEAVAAAPVAAGAAAGAEKK